MTLFDGKSIGERIAYYRKINGWSMPILEARTGGLVKRDVIANIETGRKKDLSVEQFMILAEALGVPPTALLVSLDRPFERVMLSGWGIDAYGVRKVVSGDMRWPGENGETPAALRAARLAAFAEQIVIAEERITSSLTELKPVVPFAELLDFVQRRPNEWELAKYPETVSVRIRELVQSVAAYSVHREAFEGLGGEVPMPPPWDAWRNRQHPSEEVDDGSPA